MSAQSSQPPSGPRYTVVIDEDGYPIFDGLRVQDDDLIRELLSHLHRAHSEHSRRPYLTSCEGETCFVDAFDVPLVALSVDGIDSKGCTWIFPGGIEHRVEYKSLLEDDWHRIHTFIGKDDLEAVLSHKAQARLLNHAPVEKIQLRPLRVMNPAVTGEAFWTQVMNEKRDGWEMGKVSPTVEGQLKALKVLLPKNATICVPGAGRGHEAEFLSSVGFEVTALDLSDRAKKDFEKIYPQSKVTYLVDDFFKFAKKNRQQFDGCCENTVLCALNPPDRSRYLQSIHTILKPGGLYFGNFLIFSSPAGGPPFPMSQWELRELSKELYSYYAWSRSTVSAPSRQGTEYGIIMTTRNLSGKLT